MGFWGLQSRTSPQICWASKKKYVVPRLLDPCRDPQRVDHTELQKQGLFGSTSRDRDPIQPTGTAEEGVRPWSLFGRVFKGKKGYISRKKSYVQHGSFGYRELQGGTYSTEALGTGSYFVQQSLLCCPWSTELGVPGKL